jgi:hypothetical protein
MMRELIRSPVQCLIRYGQTVMDERDRCWGPLNLLFKQLRG